MKNIVWKTHPRISLFAKLMVTLIVLVTLVMGVVMVYWLNSQRQSASAELETHATQMAMLLSKTCAGPLWNIDLKSINDQLASVMADRQIYSADLYVSGRKQPLVAKKSDVPVVDPIEREAAVIYVRDQPPLTVQVGTIRLVYTRYYMHQMLAHTRLLIGAVVLILLTSLCASTYILLRRMVKKPVGELVAMAQRIAEGDFTTSITVSSRDELGVLEGTFNFMTGRLRDLVESLEQRNKQLSREVSERMQAEEDLRKSEEFLNNVVENIPNMIFVKDAKELRFVRLNKAGEKLLGYSSEELLGKNVYDFFPESEADFFTKKDREVLQNDILLDIPEEPIQTKFGKRILHTKKIPILKQEGSAQYLLGISEDITERKRAEEELRMHRDHLEELVKERTAELTRSNTELGQFVYVASHDLQEPLRMVVSYLQLVDARYREKLDDDAREFIGFAVDGAKRMQRLINDLLAYSRVGTKGQPFQPIDCEQTLQMAMRNLQVAIQESGAQITHDPLPTVMGDATQLEQLFQNLLGNALKFRRDEPPKIHVGAEQKNGYWYLSVQDNGIGIESQYFDQIFQLFQRLHGRGVYPGTGIGLAICKKIVERHGGAIWVKSEPSRGAAFYFTIPKKVGDPT